MLLVRYFQSFDEKIPGNPKPSGREGRKFWSPPDNCHHLTTSSAYGHTSAAIWDTFFKFSLSLPIMVCFPSPPALHFREANRKACICKYVYANISIWKQSEHYFGAINVHCLEIISIKQRNCCWSLLVLSAVRVWRARSFLEWPRLNQQPVGLQASWPPLASSVHENGWPMVPCWFSAFISCSQSHWNSLLFISPPCQEHLEPQSCPLGFVTLPTSCHPHTRRTCTLFHHLSHWGRCLMVLGTGLTPKTCHLCLPS